MIGPSGVLATIGVLATAGLVAGLAHLFGLSWPMSMLLGAIVSSTDAAAVFSVLTASGTRLRRRVGLTLEVESGINDPMAVILTTAITASMVSGVALSVSHVAFDVVVELAASMPPELKLRGGASKWILRQAVADAIPPLVLNRRKVGFDTPAESWMRGRHAGFVRETLLSSAARSRGFWDGGAVERALDNTGHPYWFDIVWKLLMIEVWAGVFLDGRRA